MVVNRTLKKVQSLHNRSESAAAELNRSPMSVRLLESVLSRRGGVWDRGGAPARPHPAPGEAIVEQRHAG